jgi:hypothetical protein
MIKQPEIPERRLDEYDAPEMHSDRLKCGGYGVGGVIVSITLVGNQCFHNGQCRDNPIARPPAVIAGRRNRRWPRLMARNRT